MKFRVLLCSFLMLASFLLRPEVGVATPCLAGEAHTSNTRSTVLRQYPIPGAIEVSCSTGIGITAAVCFDLAAATDSANFEVIGSRSGHHAGKIILSSDRSTATFRPLAAFDLFETVQVQVSLILLGGGVVSDTFQFVTEQRHPAPPPKGPPDGATSLLPEILVTIDSNPTPGRLFLNSMGVPGMTNLLVMNEDGLLKKFSSADAWGFESQPNGQWTYFSQIEMTFVAIDSNFTRIRSYQTTNGATTDLHDLICSSDGSYSLMGQIQTTKDMRSEVSGGDSVATIISNVLQRFDDSDNLVFEWRGIDHYDVRDAIHENLTGPTVVFQHANSIDIDSAGNYMLSNRYLSEITKIDGRTGAIMWRFGGAHNQFTVLNDSLAFSYQHDARSLPNGHITLLDNGNFRYNGNLPESRAVEYALDTNTMTARLVWQYRHSPRVWASAMGSVQRLSTGNTLIGWGQNIALGVPGTGPTVTATEVTNDGTVVFELALDNGDAPIFSYRARKYLPVAQPVGRLQSSANQGASASAEPSLMESSGGYELSFQTSESERISVTVRDVLGRVVEPLFDGILPAGGQRLHFQTTGLSNGVYFCLIQSARGAVVRRFAVEW